MTTWSDKDHSESRCWTRRKQHGWKKNQSGARIAARQAVQRQNYAATCPLGNYEGRELCTLRIYCATSLTLQRPVVFHHIQYRNPSVGCLSSQRRLRLRQSEKRRVTRGTTHTPTSRFDVELSSPSTKVISRIPPEEAHRSED